LLDARKRVSLFSLIAGYRYRSQAVFQEGESLFSPAQIELLHSPSQLAAQPGTRLPHLWVERHGERISTLDLIDGRFVLLVGPAGKLWQKTAPAVAASRGIELAVYRLAADGDLLDREDGWRTKLKMSDAGAVLVRPDGFVAWRSTLPINPERKLGQVLSSILGRPTADQPVRPAVRMPRSARRLSLTG
jgi:putative polyketide hydroxylase